MTREWKPGDVAIVDGPGRRYPITFYKNENTDELMFNNGHGFQYRVRRLSHAARPLVVIDPEDFEQVRRLRDLLSPPEGLLRHGCGEVADALREFANPTPPKPEYGSLSKPMSSYTE